MSEVKNVTITVPVGLNGWQQTGSVVINGMKVEFPIGVETQVSETAAALLEKLIEEAKENAAEGSVGEYKQYVTDGNGMAVWEDRLAYKTTAETKVVNLEETALTYAEDDNSFYLLSPWAADLMVGDVATVKYNGTDYECKAVDGKAIQPDAPTKMVAIGNLAAMGLEGVEGSNPNAPFALVAIPNGDLTEGLYGMLIPLDGATAVTLSVTSKQTRTTVKTIDPEYLPKQNRDDNTVILTNDLTTGMQPSQSHDEAWALAQAGKHLILHTITSDGGYSLPMTEYKVNGDQRDIYFTGIDSEDTLIRWTYGVNGFNMYSKKL